MSRNFHPCKLVPQIYVSHFQVLHFWPSRIFMSRIFSRPDMTTFSQWAKSSLSQRTLLFWLLTRLGVSCFIQLCLQCFDTVVGGEVLGQPAASHQLGGLRECCKLPQRARAAKRFSCILEAPYIIHIYIPIKNDTVFCFNEFAFTVQVKHNINNKQIIGFILICLYFTTGHFHTCLLCNECSLFPF